MSGRVTIGRPRASVRSLGERRRAVRDELVAGGDLADELVTGYDLTHGSLGQQRFYRYALAAGLDELLSDRWPCDAELGDVAGCVFRDDSTVLTVAPDGTVALLSLYNGWFRVQVASTSRQTAAMTCSAFRQSYPASYLSVDDGGKVPVTFWMLGRFGPESRLRRLDSATWESIEQNYSGEVKAELGELMQWSEPGREGQLLLWQGPPGTGKTWALRALASQWAPWAEFHYITDPDAFFVKDSSYMVDVLLADSYDVIDAVGDVYSEQRDSKWRVLILEDTGELLAATAKQSYGQGLSRLLNVVDGMIGQGLRVLALITTNDELGSLHPAVARPGRCASQLTFGPLDAAEASVFLGTETDEGGTLAELYARRTAGAPAFEIPERDHPDDPEPEDARDLMAAALTPEQEAMNAAFEDVLALARKPL
jgi:ATPase family associated with various cellular activities (AAA)/Domain of unknown function (DUF5925)